MHTITFFSREMSTLISPKAAAHIFINREDKKSEISHVDLFGSSEINEEDPTSGNKHIHYNWSNLPNYKTQDELTLSQRDRVQL